MDAGFASLGVRDNQRKLTSWGVGWGGGYSKWLSWTRPNTKKEALGRTIITTKKTKKLGSICTCTENSLVLAGSGGVLTTGAVVTGTTVACRPVQAGTSAVLARCAQLAVAGVILLCHVQIGAQVTRRRCVAADGAVVTHGADVASHAICWGGAVGLQCTVVTWFRDTQRE